jgi:peptidoglycan hydrolase-like protein with peptidoglycan-binding domain/3D (Asp-Asp-Asp) domain-containing protein
MNRFLSKSLMNTKNLLIHFWRIIIASVLLASSSLWFHHQAQARAQSYPGTPRKFVVTAYYSPLPGQSYYLRGSYEADIRLNGRGTHGASGQPVYPGMIAAPKNYAFGTKIHVPGLGVGTVHDRGGAIIAREEFDRIDIWMGSGEEGLRRALAWGKRVVIGTVLSDPSTANTLSFDHILPGSTVSLPSSSIVKDSPTVAKSQSGQNVRYLQESLQALGYFDHEVTGFFGPVTRQAVLDFQLDNGVIQSSSAAGAGVFGPKTKAELASQLEIRRFELEIYTKLFPVGMNTGSADNNVKRLQLILKDLGYFDHEVTGFFGPVTRQAVLDFQLDNGLIQSAATAGAGYFGPQTQAKLTEILNARKVQFASQRIESSAKIANFQLANAQVKPAAAPKAPREPLFQTQPRYGQTSSDVKRLQQILIAEDLLADYYATGFFGNLTRQAVVEFQLKHQVITATSNAGAGVVGPATTAKIIELGY